MVSRRFAVAGCVVATAASFFALGAFHTRRVDAAASASYDVRLEALREELKRALGPEANGEVTQTGTIGRPVRPAEAERLQMARAQMVTEIKEQLRHEMGLLPLSLLRERRSSFVELHSYDSHGQKDYGTAGYFGGGYLITVKHAVVPMHDDDSRTITSLKVVYKGKEIPARLVDAGDARMEVDKGDWAIIRTRELDLPPLRVDTAFPYEFAEPIFRLGNDYSKGIVVSTGYVGQRTETGLVTCLTDGHPGVSGGGVLDQRGALVGIPIGRMQGDYRFSFILPIRPEMLRKVPVFTTVEPSVAVALPDAHAPESRGGGEPVSGTGSPIRSVTEPSKSPIPSSQTRP